MSLAASAAGCKSPQGPTRFGPGRSCIHPRILRSARMAYANDVTTTKSSITDLMRTSSHTGIYEVLIFASDGSWSHVPPPERIDRSTEPVPSEVEGLGTALRADAEKKRSSPSV